MTPPWPGWLRRPLDGFAARWMASLRVGWHSCGRPFRAITLYFYLSSLRDRVSGKNLNKIFTATCRLANPRHTPEWTGFDGILHPQIFNVSVIMLSPRRAAQFGLVATFIVLVSSLSALIARNIDANRSVARLERLVPDFQLSNLKGHSISLASLHGKVVVLYFNSARCPVCNDYAPRVIALANRYAHNPKVAFLAIDSDSGDGEMADLDELRVQAKVLGQPFPTLLDPRGVVASLFEAEQTPSFYVIDADGILRYRGAFDNNRHAADVTSHYVGDAVRQLLAGQPVAMSSSPTPDGCPMR